jgi:hypothetical protein
VSISESCLRRSVAWTACLVFLAHRFRHETNSSDNVDPEHEDM